VDIGLAYRSQLDRALERRDRFLGSACRHVSFAAKVEDIGIGRRALFSLRQSSQNCWVIDWAMFNIARAVSTCTIG
jgi:hypothetical protein